MLYNELEQLIYDNKINIDDLVWICDYRLEMA